MKRLSERNGQYGSDVLNWQCEQCELNGQCGGNEFNGQDGQCGHYDLTWQYGRDGSTGQDGSVSNGQEGQCELNESVRNGQSGQLVAAGTVVTLGISPKSPNPMCRQRLCGDILARQAFFGITLQCLSYVV